MMPVQCPEWAVCDHLPSQVWGTCTEHVRLIGLICYVPRNKPNSMEMTLVLVQFLP